jgi:hypothetical protein
MADREIHWIQAGAGNAKIGFSAPDVYSDIGSVVGVTKLGNADTVDSLGRVGDMIRQGQVMRLRIRYEDTDGEMASAFIICDLDKAPSAIAALRNKSFQGGTIKSANIMRRRRLG